MSLINRIAPLAAGVALAALTILLAAPHARAQALYLVGVDLYSANSD